MIIPFLIVCMFLFLIALGGGLCVLLFSNKQLVAYLRILQETQVSKGRVPALEQGAETLLSYLDADHLLEVYLRHRTYVMMGLLFFCSLVVVCLTIGVTGTHRPGAIRKGDAPTQVEDVHSSQNTAENLEAQSGPEKEVLSDS